MTLTCKDLVSIFKQIGGKMTFTYETKTCSLLPNDTTVKITSDDSTSIDLLLSEFASSGQYDKFISILPESEKSKNKSIIDCKLHDYQEKNTGGFIVEFTKNNEGYYIPTKK